MAGTVVGYITENVGVAEDRTEAAAVGYLTENVGFAAGGRFTLGRTVGSPSASQAAGYLYEHVTTEPMYPGATVYPDPALYPQG